MRAFRRAKGLTQTDLGELLGITRNYTTILETGRKEPSERVARLFDQISADGLNETTSIVREDPSDYRATPRRPPELILHPPAALIDRLNDLAKRSGMGLDAYCCEALDREIATPGVIYRLERADS